MANPTLLLEIVTPEAKIYSDQVDTVLVPGAEGDMGVLPLHTPLMTKLNPGELKIVKNGVETRLAVGEGFVEITFDRVSVLTDMAINESDIDEAAVEAAIRRAESALKEEHLDEENHAAVQASLLQSLAQLKVKRRKHT
ncbi:F0F1 ATP synthase subunit epsilon [soil metagenome]